MIHNINNIFSLYEQCAPKITKISQKSQDPAQYLLWFYDTHSTITDIIKKILKLCECNGSISELKNFCNSLIIIFETLNVTIKHFSSGSNKNQGQLLSESIDNLENVLIK
jgi:hypothetical protein